MWNENKREKCFLKLNWHRQDPYCSKRCNEEFYSNFKEKKRELSMVAFVIFIILFKNPKKESSVETFLLKLNGLRLAFVLDFFLNKTKRNL